MNAIETRGLTRDFGQGKGLFDLTFEVPRGRVHGFLGPNGAGKTTAIRLLLDFLRADRGAARVLGFNPRTHAPEIKARVGYVPGDLALPQGLRGRDFLAHSAGLRGGIDLDWQQELIQRLGAEPEPRIHTLSKGNKQKLALIDAMQHKPDLLIMDEPTDGLDPLFREEVGKLLQETVARGNTVFMSSHIVHEIQTMCHDVSIVLSGRLRKRARIADLVALEGLVVEATVPDAQVAAQALAAVGAQHMARRGDRIRVRLTGNPLPGIAALHSVGATDPRLRQGDLEELFLRLYQEDRQ